MPKKARYKIKKERKVVKMKGLTAEMIAKAFERRLEELALAQQALDYQNIETYITICDQRRELLTMQLILLTACDEEGLEVKE